MILGSRSQFGPAAMIRSLTLPGFSQDLAEYFGLYDALVYDMLVDVGGPAEVIEVIDDETRGTLASLPAGRRVEAPPTPPLSTFTPSSLRPLAATRYEELDRCYAAARSTPCDTDSVKMSGLHQAVS